MNDDEVINIQCRGKVARIELPTAHGPGGFGITLAPATAQDQELLEVIRSAAWPTYDRASPDPPR